jgi:hypothetical protein
MRIVYPTYHEESVDADYPFESGASRSNGGVTIENDVFVDGRLFPPDGRRDLFISAIEIDDEVTITLSDGAGEVGSGTFDRNTAPEYVTFYSADDAVYLGLLQGSMAKFVGGTPEAGLSKLAGWPDGIYNFAQNQTRFAATVVVPQPQRVVRSIVLDSGAVFRDHVVLYGERGVQLTIPELKGSSSSSDRRFLGFAGYRGMIRVDVVGDPLFVRRGCEDRSVDTKQDVLITGIVFDGHTITPDDTGGFLLTLAALDASDRPALRIIPEMHGLRIGFIGD